MNAQFWSIVWEVIKVAVVPLCIWYFQRYTEKQDAKKEAEYIARKRAMDEQQKTNTDIQFLMMERMDNLSEMTHLMAKKLHDAGIINGDLEELNQKYKGLNSEYEKSIKSLALQVLNQ